MLRCCLKMVVVLLSSLGEKSVDDKGFLSNSVNLWQTISTVLEWKMVISMCPQGSVQALLRWGRKVNYQFLIVLILSATFLPYVISRLMNVRVTTCQISVVLLRHRPAGNTVCTLSETIDPCTRCSINLLMLCYISLQTIMYDIHIFWVFSVYILTNNYHVTAVITSLHSPY